MIFLCLLSRTLLGTIYLSVSELCGVTRRHNNTFCLIVLFLSYHQKFFLNIGFAILPKNGAPADAISPIGSAPLFVFFLFFFYIFFYTLCTKDLFLQIVFLS